MSTDNLKRKRPADDFVDLIETSARILEDIGESKMSNSQAVSDWELLEHLNGILSAETKVLHKKAKEVMDESDKEFDKNTARFIELTKCLAEAFVDLCTHFYVVTLIPTFNTPYKGVKFLFIGEGDVEWSANMGITNATLRAFLELWKERDERGGFDVKIHSFPSKKNLTRVKQSLLSVFHLMPEIMKTYLDDMENTKTLLDIVGHGYNCNYVTFETHGESWMQSENVIQSWLNI